MKNDFNQIYILNQFFDLCKTEKSKYTYKWEDRKNQILDILEMRLSNDNKIEKIDVYTMINGNMRESIHIVKDVDGKMIVDYYPQKEELVIIDKKERMCEVVISYYLDINNLDMEIVELTLKRVNHKKTKTLIQVPKSNYFSPTPSSTILQNRFYSITCDSIEQIKNKLECLPLEIVDLEEKLKGNNATIEQESVLTEFIEAPGYPSSIYVYDRMYDILGWQGDRLVYRNTQEDIQDIEVTFSEKKDKIILLKIKRYVRKEVDGINTIIDKMIITMNPQKEEEMNTSLETYTSGYALVESKDLEEELKKNNQIVDLRNSKVSHLFANTILTSNLKTVSGNLQLDIVGLGVIDLKVKSIIKNYFTDIKNYEYRISMQVYSYYKFITQSSFAIMENLENSLIERNIKKNKVLEKK